MASQECSKNRRIAASQHLLIELSSLSDLSFPVSFSSRIKYTCLAVSPKFLAVGSSSGSIYLFSRYASKYRPSVSSTPVQVISCQKGGVSSLKLPLDEKFLCAASSNGHVTLISLTKAIPETIQSSSIHLSSVVSAICWAADSSRVFAGDSAGRVSVLKVAKSHLKACELLLHLDSCITQCDTLEKLLLVSSYTRTVIYNCVSGGTISIGRSSRNGPFGACFYSWTRSDLSTAGATIFCSRPNARLWEAELSGKVCVTHNFDAVDSLPCAPVLTLNDETITPCSVAPALQFSNLHVVSKSYILSVTQNCVFIIDVMKAKLLLVSELPETVCDFACCDRDLFVLTAGGALRKFSFYPVEKAISKLYLKKRHRVCAALIHAHESQTHSSDDLSLSPEMLKDILLQTGIRRAASNNDFDNTDAQYTALVNRSVSAVLQRVIRSSTLNNASSALLPQSVAALKLPSGITKVLKPMENSGYEDDFLFKTTQGVYQKQKTQHQLRPATSVRRRQSLTSTLQTKFALSQLKNQQHGSDATKNADKDVKSNGHGTLYAKDDLVPNSNLPSKFCMMSTSRSEASLLELLKDTPPEFDPHRSPGNLETNSHQFNHHLSEDPTTPVSPTPPDPKPSQHCPKCGLNETWICLLRLSPILPGLKFACDSYDEGGVPVTTEQWRDLFLRWASVQKSAACIDRNVETGPEGPCLCISCKNLFSRFKEEIGKPGVLAPQDPCPSDFNNERELCEMPDIDTFWQLFIPQEWTKGLDWSADGAFSTTKAKSPSQTTNTTQFAAQKPLLASIPVNKNTKVCKPVRSCVVKAKTPPTSACIASSEKLLLIDQKSISIDSADQQRQNNGSCMGVSIYFNPIYEVDLSSPTTTVVDIGCVKPEEQELTQKAEESRDVKLIGKKLDNKWLTCVGFDSLVALAVEQLDVGETMQILQENEQLHMYARQAAVGSVFACAMVKQHRMESGQQLKLPQKFVDALLFDLKFQHLVQAKPPDCDEANDRRNVYLDETCMFCTLPLSCRVSTASLTLMVFKKCGHGCHKVCFPHNLEKKCPKCHLFTTAPNESHNLPETGSEH